MQTYTNNKKQNNLAKKLPMYYLGGVALFLFIFTIFKQAPLFKAALLKDSSFAAGETVAYKASSAFNQDGSPNTDKYNQQGQYWFGNGGSRTYSFLGLYFNNVTLPPSQNILRATLRFSAANTSWVQQKTQIYGEKSNSPTIFSSTLLPSQRQLTTSSVRYADNKRWAKDQTYTLPEITSVVRELAGSGNTQNVSLVLRGVGTSYGRKFIYGPQSDKAPQLIIETGTTAASATPAPIISTPVPATPAPTTATKTPSPTIMTPPPQTTTTSGAGTNSMAMGKWSPSKFDTCTKEEHDAFSVTGPDGKRYPTWHPINIKRADGTTCTFGHEHGRNPAGYAYWDEIKRHYAYDADNNGVISDAELATAGIPFGYVNEQIDTYYAANPTNGFMRHEDHVGHKIDYANGEGDIGDGTDPFDSNMTGGVVVPIKSTTGGKWDQSGIRCYHFHKIHQGVHSPDALTNNLHEALLHQKCTSTRTDFPALSTTILSGMVQFGAAGEFTRFCDEDRDQIIRLGTTDANKYFPGVSGNGFRNINTRDCLEQKFLVQPPAFSSLAYEDWSGGLEIRNSSGQLIAANGGAWEVLDAIRYYNPNTANKIGYFMDLCYENFNGRVARGIPCDNITDYGNKQGITWDSTQSGFRGIHRGQYIQDHTIHNNGGQVYMYTDAFGGKAQKTPFLGSIRQYISAVEADVNFPSDPRIVQRWHDDGGDKVHAPN